MLVSYLRGREFVASFAHHSNMGLRLFIMFMLAGSYVFSNGSAADSPKSVVRELYQQIVARRPLGIPKREDKAAIWPYLSKGLIHRLETAQACEDSYFQQHAGEDGKPGFNWLEVNLFSGGNEQAIPSSAVVERTVTQKEGSLRVYVRLTYKESFETYGKPPNPANKFNWRVAPKVVLQQGHPVVDDVLFFKDDSTQVDSRLSDSFTGCDGPRWVGDRP
jgi:hypothetical protein